jgi:hypothetical protein
VVERACMWSPLEVAANSVRDSRLTALAGQAIQEDELRDGATD